jgi:hypothetical protein
MSRSRVFGFLCVVLCASASLAADHAVTERLELAAGDSGAGIFTSQVLDAGERSAFVSLMWLSDPAPGSVDLRDTLASVPGAGALRFQLKGSSSEAITLCGWMRESDEDARSIAATGARIALRWNASHGAVEATLRTDAGHEITMTGVPGAAASDRAHHVAVVIDGGAGEAGLYLDGHRADRVAIEARPFHRDVAVAVAGAAAAPFGPEVPELAVVPRALSEDEIEALARRGLVRVRLQVARCVDALCADAVFVGPDGTEATSFDAQQEWSLAGIHAGRFIRYRVVLESADPVDASTVASVVVRTEEVPFQPFADADGDGVDDALDCRPQDPNTWAVPTEAPGLVLTGNPPSFSWSAPADPGSTVVRYDVLRGGTASGLDACVARNEAGTASTVTDPLPFSPLFYVVRAKNACGSSLGTDTNGAPRTGPDCFFGAGASCTASLECQTGCCSPNVCAPLGTISNCGSCGNACAGQTTSSDAVCAVGNCGMTCRGERYDANANASDGCEAADNPTGNHTIPTAILLGNHSCNDSDTITGTGSLPSDSRAHISPGITGFNTSTGAAPDYFTIAATGGLCTNDIALTLTVTGATTPACFKLTVIASSGSFNCTTNASATCTVSRGSGAYTDGSNITVIVEKTCTLPNVQQVTYAVGGHI